ncbi:MAG TPA: TRAP transporter substrate-binding protein [Geminicoccaceae bacterium]|nr:TRAP transporter substrate-binding protein [Geminicoccaceae bacterium]
MLPIRSFAEHASSALAASLVVGWVGVAAAAETWDLANEYNATSIHAEGDVFFAEQLKEMSGGQIEIVHHFGGALGYKSLDQFDAVGDGAIPIADTYVGPLGGIDPMFLLPSLPFLAKTADEARLLYEVAKPYYDEIFAASNQKLLYSSPWPPSGIWAKKPVASMADLANLKIRTYDANGTIALKNAGAAPIQLSWADVVPQLSTGGIDAVLTSAESGANAKFWEHLSHFTEINYAMPLNMLHINLDTFNGLSPELQEAVLGAADATSARNWEAVLGRVEANYAEMQQNGLTLVTEVPEDYLAALNEAGREALEDWLAKTGDKGRAIIEEYEQNRGS